jgi:hypothetical protein
MLAAVSVRFAADSTACTDPDSPVSQPGPTRAIASHWHSPVDAKNFRSGIRHGFENVGAPIDIKNARHVPVGENALNYRFGEGRSHGESTRRPRYRIIEPPERPIDLEFQIGNDGGRQLVKKGQSCRIAENFLISETVPPPSIM